MSRSGYSRSYRWWRPSDAHPGYQPRPGLISPDPLGASGGGTEPTLAPTILRRRRLTLGRVSTLLLTTDAFTLVGVWTITRINVVVAVLMGLVAIGLFTLAGLYRSRLTLSALDAVPAVLGRAVVAGAVAQSVADILHQGSAVFRVSLTAALWAVALTAARALMYVHIRRHRASPRVIRPTLILGAGAIGNRIGTLLRDHPEYGLLPVGFVDDDPMLGPDDLAAPVLGGKDDLSHIIAATGARDVVVAFSLLRESSLVDVIRSCDRADCEIYLVPRLFELHQDAAGTDHLWGLPLARLPRTAFRSPLLRVKRMMDVAVAGIGLLVLAPVLAGCALAARLETGRAIFRQERVGVDGRPFDLLKFQSLRPADPSESALRWSVADDVRLRPVGQFLRRTSLDELPQLWNILRGHMSFVGPRPERPFFAGQFAGSFPRYSARTRVRVGLTGWAQVHQLRGDTSIEDRVIFDNHYIEHWSLWGDVKIMLRTVTSVVKAVGR